MSDRAARLAITNITGGRNGYDAPWAIQDTQCVDAVNVDFYKSRCGNKRGGMADPSLTSGFSGTVSSLFRHVPSTDESAAELWGVDDSGTPAVKRLAAGTAWSAPTLKDSPTGNGWDFTAASINGLLVLAYKSGQNRLHAWDGSTVRRMGLATPAAPTAADTGSGSYAAVLRYYRVRWTVQSGGITVRRSEASASVSFTPSSTGSAARVTKPSAASEGETHWELEASTDDVTFYLLATTVVGTTTYDDSADTTTYSSGTLSPLTGVYQLQKSYKFVAADQNRLLGFGNYDATGKQCRIEISAVIGSSDIGDAERVDTSEVNSIIDLDENDSGFATGLCGPVFGSFFAFKNRQVCQLTATGTIAQPYRQDFISKSIGAVEHQAIAVGEDNDGNAAIYWMSHRGPYRFGVNGLEYIGRNMEDYILPGQTATINLAATKRIAVTRYYSDKQQVWFWWATGSSNDCCQLGIFDVKTNGWTRVPTGDKLANIRCAVLFSTTIGASMSRDLKPYVGQTGGTNRVWKCDTGTDDNGTAFQAYVLTKAYEVGGAGFYGRCGDGILLAKTASGVTITDTVTADFGKQTQSGTAVLTATADEGSATRVTRVIEGGALAGDVRYVQHQLGDASAASNAWTLDSFVVPIDRKDAIVA
jgi:hypothetical protein